MKSKLILLSLVIIIIFTSCVVARDVQFEGIFIREQGSIRTLEGIYYIIDITKQTSGPSLSSTVKIEPCYQFEVSCDQETDCLDDFYGGTNEIHEGKVHVGDRVKVLASYVDANTVSICGNRNYYIKLIRLSREPKCSGTITGYVYDDATNAPIKDSLVECGRISDYTNSRGWFSLGGDFCPNNRYTIECSAGGYKSDTKRVTTDSNGDGSVKFYLDPDCDGTISGYVRDATTRAPISGALVEVRSSEMLGVLSANSNSHYSGSSGRFSIDGNFCPNTRYTIRCSAEGYKLAIRSITTERDGNKEVDIYLEPERPVCSGVVSGHVYDASTRRPISGASLLICQGGSCCATPITDSWGSYRSMGSNCPFSSYEITCSADGYTLETKRATTDGSGNSVLDFTLVPLCRGTISGKVYDSATGRPIPGAALLFCQGGDCWCPQPSDAMGYYSAGGRICPSTTWQITCSADGYTPGTKTITTDKDGNFRNLNIPLEQRMAPVTKDIKFIGTCTASSWATMDFGFDFFEVDQVLEGPDIEGDEVMVSCVIGPYDLGNYDAVTKGDKAEVYARFQVADGKRYEEKVGRNVWDADIASNNKYYIKYIKKPDLIISNIFFSKIDPLEGEPIDITVIIKNVGEVDMNEDDYCLLRADTNIKYKIGDGSISYSYTDLIDENIYIKNLKAGEETEAVLLWYATRIYNDEPFNQNTNGQLKFALNFIVGYDNNIDEVSEDNYIAYANIDVIPASSTKFRVERHGYHFRNDDLLSSIEKDMEAKYLEDIFMHFPESIYLILYDEIKGNCLGMSATSANYYKLPSLLPVGSGSTFELEKTNYVIDQIIRYQVYQILQNWNTFNFLRRVNFLLLRDEARAYTFIREQVLNDNPVLIQLGKKNDSTGNIGFSHAVLGYAVYDDAKNVIVYDPNYPGSSQTIHFESNSITYREYEYALPYSCPLDVKDYNALINNAIETLTQLFG